MKGKFIRVLIALVLVLSLNLVTAVPAAAATDYYVRTDGSDTNDGSANDAGNAWLTIQHAIDTVAATDIINVAAGTYIEDLVIPADKTGLELSGDGATIKQVQLSSDFPNGLANIGILASGVKVHGFTIQGPEAGEGWAAGIVIGAHPSSEFGEADVQDIEIYDNVFEITAATSDPSVGIQTSHVRNIAELDFSGLSIHNNIFTSYGEVGVGYGYDGIYINPDKEGTGSISITDNEFSGSSLRAITIERSNVVVSGNVMVADDGWRMAGVLIRDYWGVAQDAVTVTNNSIEGFETGILIGQPAPPESAPPQILTNIAIESNSILGNDTGVLVRSSANGVTLNDNTIVGNVNYGISNIAASGTVDATNNWWGSANGPVHAGNTFNVGSQGDTATDYVDYVPWYNTNMTGTSFAPVKNTTDDPDTLFSSIQAAIDASTTADAETITAVAGTYTEDLDIDKKLTLTGRNLADTANSWTTGTAGASSTAPTIVYGTANNFINVNEADVTIQGFKIDASTFTGMNAGIYWTGTRDETTIRYNTLNADNGDRLINLADGAVATDFLITYNAFTIETDEWGNWFGMGVNGGCSNGNVLSYNSVVGGLTAWLDLGTNNIYDITFSNNDMDYGIVLNETIEQSTGLYGDIVVNNNTWAGDPSTSAFEIAASVEDADWAGGTLSYDDVTIQYNDFSGYLATGADTILVGTTAGHSDINALYNWWGDASGPTTSVATDRGEGADVDEADVDYEPWLTAAPAGVIAADTRAYGYDLVTLVTGWNTFSTPIALDPLADTWGEYRQLGVPLDLATGANAFYFNGSSQSWGSVLDSYQLTPVDALYIKMASDQTSPILFSTAVSVPSKDLYAGWNLVSASYFSNIDSPDATSYVYVWEALYSVSRVPGDASMGYTIIVNPPVAGQQASMWIDYRNAPSSGGGDKPTQTENSKWMYPTEGYWVFMTNPGTLAGTVFTPVSPLLPGP